MGKVRDPRDQWIGLREKLQESPIYHGKWENLWLPVKIFPSTNPLKGGFRRRSFLENAKQFDKPFFDGIVLGIR